MVVVGRVRGSVVFLNMPDGALFLPRTGLMRVGVDAGSSWCAGSAAAASFGVPRRRVDFFYGALRTGCLANVAVAFQDLSGRDVFVFVEERSVVEERLEIFRYLWKR